MICPVCTERKPGDPLCPLHPEASVFWDRRRVNDRGAVRVLPPSRAEGDDAVELREQEVLLPGRAGLPEAAQALEAERKRMMEHYIVIDMRDYTIFGRNGKPVSKRDAEAMQRRMNADTRLPPRTFRVFRLVPP